MTPPATDQPTQPHVPATNQPTTQTLPAPEDITDILRGVIDPELGSDIVDLGMLKDVSISADGTARITIALTTMGCPLRAQIKQDAVQRVAALDGIADVKVDWTVLTSQEKAETMARARKRIAENPPATAISMTTRVLLVASGKGGVGKSTVTVNLAAALAAAGYHVGVLDADIWGFSVPRMLGVAGRLEGEIPDDGLDEMPTDPGGEPPTASQSSQTSTAGTSSAKTSSAEMPPTETPPTKIRPLEKPCPPGSLKVVSMGLLVENEETALMWRGLILNRAVRHFLEDVSWGELDYLLVDMPPGTGDVQMGIAKLLPRADMLVITTPSLAAQKVAVRAANMGRKNYLRIAGVIENMSGMVGADGSVVNVFGEGGGEALAEEVGAPLLGQIPLDPAVAQAGDDGVPVTMPDGSAPASAAPASPASVSPAKQVFEDLAQRLIQDIAPPLNMSACTARLLGGDLSGGTDGVPVELSVS